MSSWLQFTYGRALVINPMWEKLSCGSTKGACKSSHGTQFLKLIINLRAQRKVIAWLDDVNSLFVFC